MGWADACPIAFDSPSPLFATHIVTAVCLEAIFHLLTAPWNHPDVKAQPREELLCRHCPSAGSVPPLVLFPSLPMLSLCVFLPNRSSALMTGQRELAPIQMLHIFDNPVHFVPCLPYCCLKR